MQYELKYVFLNIINSLILSEVFVIRGVKNCSIVEIKQTLSCLV